MKLLMCKNCGDIFNLNYNEKRCSCGNTRGKYNDFLNAEYSGEFALLLGFSNNSFENALRKPKREDGLGVRFEAFIIPDNCETFKKNFNKENKI